MHRFLLLFLSLLCRRKIWQDHLHLHWLYDTRSKYFQQCILFYLHLKWFDSSYRIPCITPTQTQTHIPGSNLATMPNIALLYLWLLYYNNNNNKLLAGVGSQMCGWVMTYVMFYLLTLKSSCNDYCKQYNKDSTCFQTTRSDNILTASTTCSYHPHRIATLHIVSYCLALTINYVFHE